MYFQFKKYSNHSCFMQRCFMQRITIKTIIVLFISKENVLSEYNCVYITFVVAFAIYNNIKAIINANNVIYLTLNRTADIGKSIARHRISVITTGNSRYDKTDEFLRCNKHPIKLISCSISIVGQRKLTREKKKTRCRRAQLRLTFRETAKPDRLSAWIKFTVTTQA